MAKTRRALRRLLSGGRDAAQRSATRARGIVPLGVRQRVLLRGLPPIEPSEEQLRRWAVASGVEYQAWCFHHGFISLAEWRQQRAQALAGPRQRISILTPAFNTPVSYLRECVYSVQAQSYPFWELCLVDDASTDAATIAELERLAAEDPRITLRRLAKNLGICDATNEALRMARGRYVAMLDHDDRLAPDALHHVAELLASEQGLDGVYSDRDLLTELNYRTMPFLKPNWAPETLLGGNYLFHLTVYRRSLMSSLGGYRADYEGSQDLDLALRVAEGNPRIAHITRVLYHWRQHEDSMALRPDEKEYIFDAGIKAVEDALVRRGMDGTVEEIPNIWRGNYRVHLRLPDNEPSVVRVDDPGRYREVVNAALLNCDGDCLVVVGPGVEPTSDDTYRELVAWLDQPSLGAVTARIVSSGGFLQHAGLVRRPEGEPLAPYCGYRMEDPGYGAMTASIRNVSLLHPMACAWRVDVLRAIGGLPATFDGPYAMLDASIAAESAGHRLLYNPLATVVSDHDSMSPTSWPEDERERFVNRRSDAIDFDWQHHWAFDRAHVDMRLGLAAPTYRSDLEPEETPTH